MTPWCRVTVYIPFTGIMQTSYRETFPGKQALVSQEKTFFLNQQEFIVNSYEKIY